MVLEVIRKSISSHRQKGDPIRGQPSIRKKRECDEEVSTPNALARRESSVSAACSGVGGQTRQSATSHTLSPLIRSTSRHFLVFDSGACFFVLLRDFFCHFPNFCSSTFFFTPTEKTSAKPFLHDADNSSVRCWLGWGSFFRVCGGKRFAFAKIFFWKISVFFSRHTQKRRRRTCKTRSGHGKRVHEMKFRARTKMRLLLCRRRGRSKNTLSR